VTTSWWQELWRRHAHITTPLRQRGLECDIEFGVHAYVVRVSLPDNSYLIISPPQEQSSDCLPGAPEGWNVTRENADGQAPSEVLYDSAPSTDPGAPERPEARHGGSAAPLIEAIDRRLAQLGLLPSSIGTTTVVPQSPTQPALHAPTEPDASIATAQQASAYIYGDALLALTDQLNATESYADAAALLHQVLDPINGLLERLGEFFEAAGEKAKEAQDDDGFDLSYDLADAAAEIRNLSQVLHVAEDRMRALTPQTPAPARPAATPPHPAVQPPQPPPANPPRHTR
jgi:hypothetical protein